ncbi:JmjC domain-containing protein [Paraburkholderia bannensis]|uniref:JmjC domain-containing protein n=1 Tax=Paraburkholderia bannensis TaxID=765414 RepID=UPI002AB13A60|nr:cupin domain-containing protein [Paraburkholderia bannensis]
MSSESMYIPQLALYLFGDLDPEEFRDNFFETTHLHIRSASSLYSEFNFHTFENYLTLLDGHLDEIVFISNNGEPISVPPVLHHGQSQLKYIYKAIAEGATLRVGGIERRNALISSICAEIESLLFGTAIAKLFFTPNGHHGFSTHYDGESVFVVQLFGSKKWTLYPNACRYATKPLAKTTNPSDLRSPVLETILKPGDVLYLPSGVPHHAESLDEDSLHLSIGLSPWNAADFVSYVVTELMKSSEILRHPLSGQHGADSQILHNVVELVRDELSQRNSADFMDQFRRSMHGSRPSRNFNLLHNIGTTQRETNRIRIKRNRTKHVEIENTEDYITLYLGSSAKSGGTYNGLPSMIRIPSHARTEVEFLVECCGYYYADEIPGVLDNASKIALARRLIEHEILNVE